MRGFLERQGFEVLRQEAGTLKLRYLSDHFFFFQVMPRLLALAKRFLFKTGAKTEGRTITELYEDAGGAKAGVLGDRLARQRLVNLARLAFQIGFTPAALTLKLYYRSRERLCGDCLYTLARKR